MASAWEDGLAVCEADDAVVYEAAVGNEVACGDDNCDDNIPRTLHSQR